MCAQENPSADKGFVRLDSDRLFESLCAVTGILDKLQVPYTLTGGTLLGAIREGDLIEGDTDWDIDINSDDIPFIVENVRMFEEHGLLLRHKVVTPVVPLNDSQGSEIEVVRSILKFVDADGGIHGDLFGYKRFSDGIMRQVVIEDGTYFNAKMSFPAWFFENPEEASIRGESFKVPGAPKKYLERVYGPNWHIPITRYGNDIPKGYNFAGAHLNADIESAIAFAIDQGWVPYYPDSPNWPVKISHVLPGFSGRWIHAHEFLNVLEIMPDLPAAENAAIQVQQLKQLIVSLKRDEKNNRSKLRKFLSALNRMRKKPKLW